MRQTHDRRSRRLTLACAFLLPRMLSTFPKADAPVPAAVSRLTAAVTTCRAVTEVAKKIGEQWKTLTDKEKKVRHV